MLEVDLSLNKQIKFTGWEEEVYLTDLGRKEEVKIKRDL